MDTPVLLIDGDCGFCRVAVGRLQQWFSPTAPAIAFQQADLAALGVRADECASAIQWIDQTSGARVHRRAAAAGASWLATGNRRARLVAAVLRLPLVRKLAERVYVVVARNRHRLPPHTCAMPTR